MKDYLEISKLYFQEKKGLKFLRALIYYLYSTIDTKFEDIIEIIATIPEKGGEEAMTIAARLIEKGRNEGKDEGLKEGLQQALNGQTISLSQMWDGIDAE